MTPAFSRRLVLGGMASLAVAATVKTAATVPVLWGDGIHDDAPALNALFRGDPIRVLNGRVIEGERPAVVDARLLLGSTLAVGSTGSFVLSRSTLTAMPGFKGEWLIDILGGDGVLSDLRLDTSNVESPAHRGLILFTGPVGTSVPDLAQVGIGPFGR